MLNKGINFWSFAPGISAEHAADLAAAAGFDGVEFCLDGAGPLTMDTTDDEVRALGKQLNDRGLKAASVASGLPWEYPMTSNDPAKRATATKVATRQIEVAGILEAGAVLIVPGYVGCDFVPGAEIIPTEQALSRARESISSLIPVAEKHGIDIGIENVWNKMLQTPVEMRDFLDSFDNERVGSYFDVANPLINGYPEDWIRVLGKRIKRVHFKDYRRAVGTVDGFVGLLNGDVNFPAVVEALAEVGYSGFCTAEILPPFQHHNDAMAHMTSIAMDYIMGKK